MSGEPTPRPERAGAPDPVAGPPGRDRWWDRGSVWLVLIALGVVLSLAAAAWVDRDGDEVSGAPADPSGFCNTVGELHSRGDISFAADDPAGSLQAVSDGLGELQLTGPPAQIRRDLQALELAVDPVIRRALASQLGEPATPAELAQLLTEQTSRRQPESDRVNAYARQWCGVDLNGTADPDEGTGPRATPAPTVVIPTSTPTVTPSPG